MPEFIEWGRRERDRSSRGTDHRTGGRGNSPTPRRREALCPSGEDHQDANVEDKVRRTPKRLPADNDMPRDVPSASNEEKRHADERRDRRPKVARATQSFGRHPQLGRYGDRAAAPRRRGPSRQASYGSSHVTQSYWVLGVTQADAPECGAHTRHVRDRAVFFSGRSPGMIEKR